MQGDDSARLIYLVLLGAAIISWFVAQNRASLGKVTQQALVWGLIFVGVIAAVGLWGDVRRTIRPTPATLVQGNRIELPRAPDGHYYLTAKVNGNPVVFVVDTGASEIVLTKADATASGIDVNDLIFIGRAYTANGEVRTAPVRLKSLSVGSILDSGIHAVVNEGELDQSLLGMSYLQRFTSVELSGGAMVLTR